MFISKQKKAGGILKADVLGMGVRIKEQRLTLGFSQEVLAEKVGVSPQFIADLERGKKGMSINTLSALAHVLMVSTDFLICNRGTPSDRIVDLVSQIPNERLTLVQDILLAIIKNE